MTTTGQPPRRRWTDDTGSLPMAMLLTLVGVSLSGLLVPTVLAQIGASRTAAERTYALNAAQTGINIALGYVRAADDGTGNGKLARLPCGPFSGWLGTSGASARYTATITYYDDDPVNTTAAVVPCRQRVPAYALIRSTGTDRTTGNIADVPNRALQATYKMRTTNVNIPGGRIEIYHASGVGGSGLCMDASSPTGTIGKEVRMLTCDKVGDLKPDQKFAYRSDLTLFLVNSVTAAAPLGLCLDAGSSHSSSSVVRFQKCIEPAATRQRWSFNDNQGFEGTSSSLNLDGWCFNMESPGASNSRVILGEDSGRCGGGGDNNVKTWWPESSVGAGAAGPANNQLVNYEQFGRCLDVTQQDPDYNYMIAWPCKQAPDPDDVSWNQKWTLPTIPKGQTSASGRITTRDDDDNVLYCLRSPGMVGAGRYVTLDPCPSGTLPSHFTWIRYGNAESPAEKYRIESRYVASGTDRLCLAPADQNATPSDFHNKGERVAKLFVAKCSDSELQKWNGDPYNIESVPLKDVGER